MEKIRLKDGTEHNICDGASVNRIVIPVTDSSNFVQVHNTMTEENLSEFNVLTEANEICAILKDKKVMSAELLQVDGGYSAIFVFADVDSTSRRIKALEETMDTLVMESLGV